jgi:SAM-dependent methyltransferase
MESDSPLQTPPNLTKIILNSLIGALSILLGSRLLMGDSRLAPLSRFDLRSTDVLNFASSFGLAEASNDAIEKVVKLGLPGPAGTSKSLTAFEENRSFVYALFSLSDAAEAAGRQPKPSRWSRRLIFLKPSTFVLDDEIDTGSSPASAEWLFHSRVQPAVSGRLASLLEEDHELSCETLLPERASRQVKHQQSKDKLSDGYLLQVSSKQPSQGIRFLHVLHIRRRGDKNSIARTRLVPKGDVLHLRIDASQQTYQLVLPSAQVGAGEIEISRDDTKSYLARRFFPAGVLPHGREGVKLLELWDGSYRGGKRPFWDAGVPSGELRRVVEQGIVRPGPAVDLGCGSGTDAIYLASKGFDVTAIDIAPTALSLAREKAERAGVKVRWLLANVLSLPKLEPFQFIFDRGCYHEVRFDNAAAYVEMVRKLSQPGRTRFLLLAGNPNEAAVQYAPPQVAEEDIRGDFSSLFDFEWLQETRFETSNPAARGPLAWSVMLRRKERP